MAEVVDGFHTRRSLGSDLRSLGIGAGDTVMVHAAMRSVGPSIGGPDTLIDALRDASAGGTILAYTDWDASYETLLDENGCVPEACRSDVPPFDAERSRANRENGVLAEFIRTTPVALRSGNPGASIAALGARAAWFVQDHPLDDGYGAGSPLAKLVEAGGKVLLVGAPLDTMTLLHHAEDRARLPDKRRRRVEVPLAVDGRTVWRMVEEFETSIPIVAGLDDDYFATIVRDFLATGLGRQGAVGDAPSVLVEAGPITAFAIDWLERRAG